MGAAADVNLRLRRLPKVDEVLRDDAACRLLERAPRWAVVEAIRLEIDALRRGLLAGTLPPGGTPSAGPSLALAGDAADASLEPPRVDGAALGRRVDGLVRSSLRRVLNATGVVIHTNLGRSPLADRAIERVVDVARGYSNLEYRLDERQRGSRHDHVSALITRLTGAEAALVVNNNAAAVMLVLGALAAGREVIVSRGELVEIGGSFRIPDVLRASGARLVEVGTTNRTHRRDYERAITADTALLLKVHPSNFAVVGFTAAVEVAELVEIGRARGVPVVIDLGAGNLIATDAIHGSLGHEPTVSSVVEAGADVVTCSGDKLLGGPQAGLILTRAAHREALRAHPLMRAFRPDKLCLAALEATLELYRDGLALDEVPTLRMLATPLDALRRRAEVLRQAIAAARPALELAVVEVQGAVGGGALPEAQPPSFAVAVTHPTLDANALEAALRRARPPLVARIADARLLCDVRTLRDDEIELAAAAFAEVTTQSPSSTAPASPASAASMGPSHRREA